MFLFGVHKQELASVSAKWDNPVASQQAFDIEISPLERVVREQLIALPQRATLDDGVPHVSIPKDVVNLTGSFSVGARWGGHH